MHQYPIPIFMNKKWQKMHVFGFWGNAVRKFLRLYREKIWNTKRKAIKFVTVSIFAKHASIYFFFLQREVIFHFISFFFSLDRKRVAMYIRRFPNMDMEALKEQFPNVDIKATKVSSRARGHYISQ